MNNLPLIVDIPDIVNSTGFSKVLDYVYTSNLSLSQNTVMEVIFQTFICFKVCLWKAFHKRSRKFDFKTKNI